MTVVWFEMIWASNMNMIIMDMNVRLLYIGRPAADPSGESLQMERVESLMCP